MQPLMTGSRVYDQLLPPTPVVQPTHHHTKRLVALVGFVASVTLRQLNYSLISNAIGCFGVGVAALSAVTIGVKNETAALIREITIPALGIVTIFGLSQMWANDQNVSHRKIYENTITTLLGANIQIMLDWLIRDGAIRIENHPPATKYIDSTRKLVKESCVSFNMSQAIKAVAAAGLGTFSYLSQTPILTTVARWLFPFYLGQIVGERVIHHLDQKIVSDNTAKSSYRLIKTVLLTAAYGGKLITIASAPFTSFISPVIGIFDGMHEYSIKERIKNISVGDLKELEERPSFERSAGWKYSAMKLWKLAVNTFSIGGVVGFSLWQIAVLPELDKIALTALLTGFTGACALGHWINNTWKAHKTHCLKDRLMAFLWFSHTIFGLDPIFVYYALIKTVQMNSKAILETNDPMRLAAIFFGWFAYGERMGLQQVKASSSRLGGPLTKTDILALLLAIYTTFEYVRNENS